MKYVTIVLLSLALSHLVQAETELAADESIPIPEISFDEKGGLKVTASATSSPSDFDFLVGKWKMHNRHLNKRLANCQDWTEFESSDENSKILGGPGDMNKNTTTQFHGMEGKL